jgi:hypothetical protein
MRNLILAGMAAGLGVLSLTQVASAERVCRQVCDGGACTERCVEHEDTVVIDRDRRPPPPRPGVDVHVPGVGIEIGH